ncbi:hypothetical protein [Streptomyces sp. NPDC048611]|uniref:hypothetical protein n=1 Tax=Streptomyces sp. NPDC048611 TaxID=3155635 RepID=UPI003441A138
MTEKTGISYVKGDATAPQGKGVKVIAHICNDRGGRVAGKAQELGASVHMPRIGCGLAGGTWSRVEPLVAARLTRCGIPVTVYDR